MRIRSLAVLLAAAILAGCTSLHEMRRGAIRDLQTAVSDRAVSFRVPPQGRIDSVVVDSSARTVSVRLSREFNFLPFRPAIVREIYAEAEKYLGEPFDGFRLSVLSRRRPIETMIPNYYREDPSLVDTTRMPDAHATPPVPIVRRPNSLSTPSLGLPGSNIVLWHSHGWYYNNKEDRWEWQRPRLFQTVEDLVPMSFTLPYLIPMLENAGATVFVPRERDTQIQEVIVDNDRPGTSYRENVTGAGVAWVTGTGTGFATGTPPYPVNMNPFAAGTYRTIMTDSVVTATATWLPEFPEEGEYGVSVSYDASPDASTDAQYIVYHTGGRTEFLVNQQIGGGTWLFLGKFRFPRGANPGVGRVVLTNSSAHRGKLLSADAVKFGGGLGVVERNGASSGRAKYLEGARYYLQFAGMPDTLVYNFSRAQNDYTDDYQSRGEYVNYLNGPPNGPNKDRSAGLGIPIDLSLAFHTDAGITRNDTVIGTLVIFSSVGADTAEVFPDGMSRLASRDFADILQTQIVDDMRALYDPAWTRRQLMDSRYHEAFRPNVPAALLELLSHQNFLDMRFMLDPAFRFHVSRAIYKAMLRFLAFQKRRSYMVQPLPPRALASEFRGDGVFLSWEATEDPLEPTARPDRYILYTRLEDGGFDNGRVVDGDSCFVPSIRPHVLYGFRVAAVNSGGESFPSEILSVCRVPSDKPPILIVNGFDRVSGPAWVETPAFAGFLNILDGGVPDGRQWNFTGLQHDFRPESPWKTNDAPGHGASFADREGSEITGNTFDFASVHGRSLRTHGFSHVSCSREALERGAVDLSKYRLVDLMLGKQRTTWWQKASLDSTRGPRFAAFSAGMRQRLEAYLMQGGNLFVSGAYVASDPYLWSTQDTLAAQFARSMLHYAWVTDHAARNGAVTSIGQKFLPGDQFQAFQPEGDASRYGVESADAITPVGGGELLCRYAENQFSAVVGYREAYGVVAAGFPFETIVEPAARDRFMGGVVRYLLER